MVAPGRNRVIGAGSQEPRLKFLRSLASLLSATSAVERMLYGWEMRKMFPIGC